MVEQSEIEHVLRDGIHVDEDGMRETKTFSIKEIEGLGIVDVPMFLSGLLDAENSEDFRESSPDYVKGYKYGKTGTF